MSTTVPPVVDGLPDRPHDREDAHLARGAGELVRTADVGALAEDTGAREVAGGAVRG